MAYLFTVRRKIICLQLPENLDERNCQFSKSKDSKGERCYLFHFPLNFADGKLKMFLSRKEKGFSNKSRKKPLEKLQSLSRFWTQKTSR